MLKSDTHVFFVITAACLAEDARCEHLQKQTNKTADDVLLFVIFLFALWAGPALAMRKITQSNVKLLITSEYNWAALVYKGIPRPSTHRHRVDTIVN